MRRGFLGLLELSWPMEGSSIRVEAVTKWQKRRQSLGAGVPLGDRLLRSRSSIHAGWAPCCLTPRYRIPGTFRAAIID